MGFQSVDLLDDLGGQRRDAFSLEDETEDRLQHLEAVFILQATNVVKVNESCGGCVVRDDQFDDAATNIKQAE